ncbi:hypothetical protein HUA74_17135 [Myxococcus sp. CA051A]|nr:hypothetical protein [Myxococcus sp. CA056]NTX38558.1 hypothetical protein [Myxococcus sp. CA033]NTX57431.1 hypothetical protein [Myxococcus sp. CA039A]NTX62379.1 hypothetical protein [Myxococcus sp. CA051A]
MTYDGCLLILTAVSTGGFPPNYRIVLRRQVIEFCYLPPSEINLDTSVNYLPALSLVANDQGVVATYVKKQSVSGSSPSTLGISHVDPATMTVVRKTGLAVYLGTGNITSGVPFLEADGTTLTVSGGKTGRIGGETGSGSHYIATFPDFFTSTTPPTVVAY